MPPSLPIPQLLTQPGRRWIPKPPATEEETEHLRSMIRFELPAEYLELLRFCNGGEGDLDADPLLFWMDAISSSIEHNRFWEKEGTFRDFWFFGGNGGLEAIAFDLRSGPPYPVVMIDQGAGEESAVQIAESMADFVQRIGLDPDRPGASQDRVE